MTLMRRRNPSLPFISTLTTRTVPSDGALHSVDGVSLVSMILTFGLGKRQLPHHNFRLSACLSLCPQACVTRLASVHWRRRSFQGKRIERLWFVEQPVNETVRRSANWRETIRQYSLELGSVQTRADACAFTNERLA